MVYSNIFRVSNLYNFHYVNTMCKAYFTTGRKEQWQMFISVYLERKPIISKSYNDLESNFCRHLSQVELERSLLSNHEIRNERDKKQAALLKNEERDIDLDTTAIQTAQDFEDTCNEELIKFKFADRKTDADKKNDTRSLNRKLDKSLALLIEQQMGDKHFYLLPQTLRKEHETLKQAADRLLIDFCGNDLKAQIYGNAPFGFYKYKYPKKIQENVVGAKVFVYFARYLNGNIQSSAPYKWLDRNEMKQVIPKDYYKSVQKFLIDDY